MDAVEFDIEVGAPPPTAWGGKWGALLEALDERLPYDEALGESPWAFVRFTSVEERDRAVATLNSAHRRALIEGDWRFQVSKRGVSRQPCMYVRKLSVARFEAQRRRRA